MLALSGSTTITEGWVAALRAAVGAPSGRKLHLVVSIENPGPPDATLVDMVDAALRSGDHTVSTVASTVFPSNLYADPEVRWHPEMATTDEERLNAAADDLYESYRMALPVIRSAAGNEHGTYFGRMVSWPGTSSDGYNQLGVRVRQLRAQRRLHHSSTNAAELILDGAAEVAVDGAADASDGLQIYRSTDERTRAFPCLVHIDVSVLENRLSLLAVYRHWHLISKALGNLIGLSRIQHFLAQQSGYEVGEMVIHGTVANAQFSDFGVGRIRQLADDARSLIAGSNR